MAILQDLCQDGSKETNNYTFWGYNSYGACYEQLICILPAYIIFGLTSCVYVDRKLQSTNPILKKCRSLFIRFCISITSILLPVLNTILLYAYIKKSLSIAYICATAFSAVSWLIHSVLVWRMRGMSVTHVRGPIPVLLAWMLTVVSDCIQLKTIILQYTHNKTDMQLALGIIITTVTLQVLYFVTLIPGPTHVRPFYLPPDNTHSSSINEAEKDDVDEEDESSSLLGTRRQRRYGTSPPALPGKHIELGVAEDGASIFSKLVFAWVQPLMLKGSKGQISKPDDVFQLPSQLRPQIVSRKFQQICSNIFDTKSVQDQSNGHVPEENGLTDQPCVIYSSSANKKHGKYKLISCLNKAFGLKFYFLGIVKFIQDCIGFAGPIFLHALVSYIENSGESTSDGYYYAMGLFFSTLLGAFLGLHFNYQVSKIQVKVRGALISTIYRKSVRVNMATMSKFTTGEIVNFMSTDTDRVVNFCSSFHQFWSLPFQIVVALYLLHQQVGLAFLTGLGFVLLLIPVNKWLTVKIQGYNESMMKQKDDRVKLMSEILSGIRVIKFYAWELSFQEKVNRLRSLELDSLKGIKYLDAWCVYFWATTPVLISILTFTTYAGIGGSLTAAKVFTSVALFNMLIGPLNAFPWVINGVIEAWVSARRVESFLQLEDNDLNKYYKPGPMNGDQSVLDVQIQNGHYNWGKYRSPNMSDQSNAVERSDVEGDGMAKPAGTLSLTDINLSAFKGQLIGVIGTVGCGKSSLLAALMAEMNHDRGSTWVSSLEEGFGLAAQESWIQHATLRDNILFGEEYDNERYNAVLQACALIEDLKILPASDKTEIGENGVNLSGGQKARVALARAVYQDKDIYLLDDPLSAVDAHVGDHLFNKCILGILREKTRILCTHHIRYLWQADVVVAMANGTITSIGPPSTVLNEFDLSEDGLTPAASGSGDTLHDEKDDLTGGDEHIDDTSDKLIQEEEQDKGVVKLDVYHAYWKAVGNVLAVAVFISLFFMQASRNVNDWWLAFWVTHSADQETLGYKQRSVEVQYTYSNSSITPKNLTTATDNLRFYLGIYGGLAVANSVFTLLRAFLFAYGGLCATKLIHDDVFNRILQAPISFFGETPIGRILNRFSSDVYSIDKDLPFMLNIFLAQVFGILGTIIITCYTLPWFILVLVPIFLVYYLIQKYYRKTSRELKRVTSVTRSPIYAHFSESLAGLMTIRALRASERFEKENLTRLEQNQRADFCSQAVTMWLGFWLQLLGVVMVGAVGLLSVLEHHNGGINPGLVGLAISYILGITGQLMGVITSFTETEKQMVSVERIMHYINEVPQESQNALIYTPVQWPSLGRICFNGVSFSYRRHLPNALNSVTFTTGPGEKIGIVGRTGSGKSSLFQALFRMVEIQDGYITVDGTNISHIQVQDLRSKLAIIPQDPFLFCGTIRENLDPKGNYSDAELWSILEKCHLREVVRDLGGLEGEAAEKGRHFSAGQRQLVCLARAMLTRAKILCIDEATASIDHDTDKLLQDTIRTEFRQNTVLTIAHRINTVRDSDRVIVMDSGKIAEFDTPDELLRDTQSLFYGLVHLK
ncbi:multidrug resistance-associated protein 7-like [Anneissia japonica]|uniref:multidrug resistance-associated protein 7-like n=1 Tax=Anneissia japonica TaxID=1529436 RepID=UPI00142567F2|nr:multidrug resistance-associated protein 7-like [Anneissia japonica]XP_033125833.1 multidrug resistance-associated protein 7-like [Anneissia japonica]XP_033125834.1 multidrug resistance-associated protein 7-like [Anneissia japonica]